MDSGHQVIVMKKSGNTVSFEQMTIADRKIPESINGERGHHICYVSSLTELIGKQLIQRTDRYSLNEEDISRIALASSLHDVGKSLIPRAILEKKSSLTPLEYDIIKKHTVLGSGLIEDAFFPEEPDIKRYAREIACYHHERYDGTGYPDGLAGDRIPIWAQIVSIADAYEALTSERSYKKAFSDDVALEMIANGMCGVFNPLLVECLTHAVGHQELEAIRSSLESSRAVHMETESLPPKKVLLMGNLRYVTEQFTEEAFPGAHVSVIGESGLKAGKKRKVYNIKRPYYKKILNTYDFDLILYFSSDLTYDSQDSSDAEELREVLRGLESDFSGKFLYLSSLDAAFEEPGDRGITAAAKEELCLYWAEKNGINMKIIRIPYLYGGAVKGDYLYRLFEAMTEEKYVPLKEAENARMYFLSLTDLSELTGKIAGAWRHGEGILTVNDEFHLTFGDLAGELSRLSGGVQFPCTGQYPEKKLELKNTTIRQQYSWFSRISILADLEDQYEEYLHTRTSGKSRWGRFREKEKKLSAVSRIAELILMFLVCEFLVRLTDSSLFFSIVDFRLMYVVIMGTIYGLRCGMGAAALCSVSWILAKMESGTRWITLFYEPSNWLPFIFFFLTGAVCGYVRLKKDNQIRFLEEENRLLEEKLTLTQKIYEDTFHEKRDLKRQIISSKDSFGKIFEITRQLNTVDYRELYLKIVNSFEGILENRTLSVYSVNQDGFFARLEVASREIVNDVSRSISLNTYAPVMEVLKRGEVWRNVDFLPNMPMFACGVYQDDRPLLLIFIWNARSHQRSLYYVNLFRILCELTQMSLIRAYGYSRTFHDQQYIGKTIIQKPEVFRNTLKVFGELEERHVFQFLTLAVDRKGRTEEELSVMLEECIRTNDIAGQLEDGSLWLLLSQAGPQDLKFILPRFESRGLSAKPERVPLPEELGQMPEAETETEPEEEIKMEMELESAATAQEL